MRIQKAEAERFVEVLAAAEKTGGETIIGLRRAVEMLWWRPRLVSAAELQEAMAEVAARTVGQPFRVDTPGGPLFAMFALWRFAGKSGGEHCDCAGRLCREPDRPVWPTAAMLGAIRRRAEHPGSTSSVGS